MAASVVVLRLKILCLPLPVAARSKAWVCGRSLAGIAGSNPAGGIDVLSVVSVVCCQVEVSVWADHSSRGGLPSVCMSLSVIRCKNNVRTYREETERGKDYGRQKYVNY